MISEGFGSYNTLRGTLTNRIIADGGGLKLAWNENFIISGEFGYSFNKGMNDVPLWMSIGVNYAF